MLHPTGIVPFWKIFTGMSAAAFLAGVSSNCCDQSQVEHVLELPGGQHFQVEDFTGIGYFNVLEALAQLAHFFDRAGETLFGAEYANIFKHHGAHLMADLGDQFLAVTVYHTVNLLASKASGVCR